MKNVSSNYVQNGAVFGGKYIEHPSELPLSFFLLDGMNTYKQIKSDNRNDTGETEMDKWGIIDQIFSISKMEHLTRGQKNAYIGGVRLGALQDNFKDDNGNVYLSGVIAEAKRVIDDRRTNRQIKDAAPSEFTHMDTQRELRSYCCLL